MPCCLFCCLTGSSESCECLACGVSLMVSAVGLWRGCTVHRPRRPSARCERAGLAGGGCAAVPRAPPAQPGPRSSHWHRYHRYMAQRGQKCTTQRAARACFDVYGRRMAQGCGERRAVFGGILDVRGQSNKFPNTRVQDKVNAAIRARAPRLFDLAPAIPTAHSFVTCEGFLQSLEFLLDPVDLECSEECRRENRAEQRGGSLRASHNSEILSTARKARRHIHARLTHWPEERRSFGEMPKTGASGWLWKFCDSRMATFDLR